MAWCLIKRTSNFTFLFLAPNIRLLSSALHMGGIGSVTAEEQKLKTNCDPHR
jgi:hypothetical protein